MPRLIDANALLKPLEQSFRDAGLLEEDYRKIKRWIMLSPTIDAEPVVRCKQCKQWDDSSEGRYEGGWCFCDRMQISTSPDWFCADGEAKHEQTD